MKETDRNKTWYSDDFVIFLLTSLGVFILYALGVTIFISRADDKTIGAFEVITGISGLILSFGTIFYVIRAYKVQQEQIKIQKIQIEIQRKEIADNKADLEFSRALDIIYRQLDHSNNKLVASNEDYIKYSIELSSKSELFKKYQDVQRFFMLVDYENKFYQNLFSRSVISKEDEEYLFRIYTSNLSYEYKFIISKAIEVIRASSSDIVKSFEDFIYDKYNKKFIIEGYSDERLSLGISKYSRNKLIREQFGLLIDSEMYNFNLLIEQAINVDKTFKKYNVWRK